MTSMESSLGALGVTVERLLAKMKNGGSARESDVFAHALVKALAAQGERASVEHSDEGAVVRVFLSGFDIVRERAVHQTRIELSRLLRSQCEMTVEHVPNDSDHAMPAISPDLS